MISQVNRQPKTNHVPLVDAPAVAAAPAAPAPAEEAQKANRSAHDQASKYTTAANPESPYAPGSRKDARGPSATFLRVSRPSLRNKGASGAVISSLAPSTTTSSAAAAPSPAQLQKEAQAAQKLNSGSLQTKDFEGIGADKAADLVAKMAKGDPKQLQNLERLMDDPAFAKHLGTALSKMDSGAGASLLDALYKTKEPTDQVKATLHAALDAMEPAKRGALMNEALVPQPGRALDPEVKKAVDGYLGAKVQNGTLTAESFQGIDPKVASGAIESLAAGDDKQRANLKRLMVEPGFAKTLAPALTEMKPEGRQQLLRFVGENASSMTVPLQQALDQMRPPNRRTEMLHEAFVKGDKSSVDAANRYLASSGERASEVYASLATGTPAELGKAMQRMSDPALRTLIHGLGNLPRDDAQAQFRKLGDAVFGPPEPNGKLGEKVVELMKDNPDLSAKLLTHVALDKYGSRERGKEINYAQRLAVQVFDGMSSEQLEKFNEKLGSGPDVAKAKEFLQKYTHVDQSEDAPITDADVSAAKLRDGYKLWDRSDYWVTENAGKDKMLEALRENPNGAIRKIDPSELKDIVKVFLKGGDMDKLTEIAKQLSPQEAAKLIKVIPIAAREAKAEIATGGWLGNVLSGAELSLEVSGDKGPTFGGKFSPGNAIKGARESAANSAERALNRFVLDWEQQLSKMSANDKLAFLEEMGGVRVSG